MMEMLLCISGSCLLFFFSSVSQGSYETRLGRNAHSSFEGARQICAAVDEICDGKVRARSRATAEVNLPLQLTSASLT